MTPRVLSIAGTDPSGGAGIQADLKTIGALGGYGMAVVTALVAQNTKGVRSVHVPPVEFLVEQLDAVSDDVTIDAVKLGMLHSVPLIEAVTAWLDRVQPPVVVLDPVMVATSGDRLLDAAAEEAILALCARVDLVTPNVPELAVLAGAPPATSWDAAVAQARAFTATTGATVLLKGGHLDGDDCRDAIVTENDVLVVDGRRIVTSNTHGTGCSLSSAMATLRASGLSWIDALERAKAWLAGAIEHGAALEVGHGNGPVDHFHEVRPLLPEPGWSARRWAATASVRERVDACAFVRTLGDGTLDPARFDWYLAQDAYYLGEYSRLLATASSLAPHQDEQVFWAQGAASALEAELALHRSHVGDAEIDPSSVTLAYVNHLYAAAQRGYAELVAALLPCYWLYADVGVRLGAQNRPEHPFGDWLSMYADPAFADAARVAVAITDRVASCAPPAVRDRMAAAFDRSMAHELAFFEAPVN